MNFRIYALPYCLERCADGRYLLLNRRYKPVGSASDEWVDYDTCHGIRVRLTRAQLRKLGGVYLYNDATNPARREHRAAYFAKIALLMNVEAR
jgi:hypothetical protein